MDISIIRFSTWPAGSERLTRRFTQEMMPFIGPRIDIMGPDMGTDQQIMAWIMVHNPNGLDPRKLDEHIAVHHTVTGFPEADPISNQDLLLPPCAHPWHPAHSGGQTHPRALSVMGFILKTAVGFTEGNEGNKE